MASPSPSPSAALGSAANPVLAAGVVLWRQGSEGPEFLLLKNRLHGTWGFAKGHLESGESLLHGALREVAEETGVQLKESEVDALFADTSIYQPPTARQPQTTEQPQSFKRVVYFLATGPVTEAHLQLSQEHEDCCWLAEQAAMNRLEHQALKRTIARAALRLAVLADEHTATTEQD